MYFYIFVSITTLLQYLIDVVLGLLTVSFIATIGVCGVEARMESQFEKCCDLGTSWAADGRNKCKKFTGPVLGVPLVQQVCLKTADICCIRAYHEKSCEKGKENARAGLACVQRGKPQNIPGNQQRDCCKACKLGKS